METVILLKKECKEEQTYNCSKQYKPDVCNCCNNNNNNNNNSNNVNNNNNDNNFVLRKK
jgi:hypothetical protein